MGIIQNIREYRQFKKMESRMLTLEGLLMGLDADDQPISKEQALSIPAVNACVNVIADTIASLPINLYKESEGKVSLVKGDFRNKLLNDDTGDTLDAFQFKKAMVTDYLLLGAGYAYINKERNNFKSLNYVNNQNVSINMNFDPIFKDYDILVFGSTYRDYEFLKITRNSVDGAKGIGILEENNKMLSVAYNSLVFEEVLVKSGGNKKGFLTSESKLDKDVIDKLKEAWKNLYGNNKENVVVLNKGLEFKEASNTLVEMQLNENKKTNSAEICKMFITPPSILDGTATEIVNSNWIKICIMPILSAIQTALNKNLLLEKEKGSFYFAFDTKELLKGDIEKRYKAYGEAVKAGWISKNEIRYVEDFESIEGLDIVTMSLGEVIYDIKNKKYFTPNTNSVKDSNMNSQIDILKGGDE